MVKLREFEVKVIDKQEETRAVVYKNGESVEFYTFKGNHPMNRAGVTDLQVAEFAVADYVDQNTMHNDLEITEEGEIAIKELFESLRKD